jgi:hypothetical protein
MNSLHAGKLNSPTPHQPCNRGAGSDPNGGNLQSLSEVAVFGSPF